MSFRKIPPRKNGKKYKRFSSVAIKVKGKGPSTATVFPGGRLIPDSAKAGFEYRHRANTLGLTEDEIIEKIRAKGKLLEFFGMQRAHQADEDAFWAYLWKNWYPRRTDGAEPRAIAQEKMRILRRIEEMEVLWQSEFRQKIHTWNYVKLPIAERKPAEDDFLRMYFSGVQFIFLEEDGDIHRRSLIYKGRENAMRDYGYKKIMWVERGGLDSTSAVIPVPG